MKKPPSSTSCWGISSQVKWPCKWPWKYAARLASSTMWKACDVPASGIFQWANGLNTTIQKSFLSIMARSWDLWSAQHLQNIEIWHEGSVWLGGECKSQNHTLFWFSLLKHCTFENWLTLGYIKDYWIETFSSLQLYLTGKISFVLQRMMRLPRVLKCIILTGCNLAISDMLKSSYVVCVWSVCLECVFVRVYAFKWVILGSTGLICLW